MTSNSLSPFVSFILSPLLVVSPIWAQATAPGSNPAGQPANAANLQLHVSESDGPDAIVNSKTLKGFTVQVADAAGIPVPEVAVALRLPDSGPSGTFADGTRAAVLYTDASGKVRFNNLQWGQTPGSLSLRLTAAKGDSHAGILLSENLAPAPVPVQTAASRITTSVSPAASSVTTPSADVQANRAIGQVALAAPQFAVAMPDPAVSLSTSAPMPIPTVSVTHTGASQTDTATAGQLASNSSIAKPEPAVSVTGASPDSVPHHSGKAKWIILGAVAVAAGAGFALAGKGKSSAATQQTSSLSIGTPSISIGH